MPTYSTRWRIVPEDGPETVLDSSDFTDLGGPIGLLPAYEAEKVARVNIARKWVEKRFGFRPSVRVRFALTSAAEEALVVEILNALMRNRTEVFLSLDGGVTERPVYLDGDYVREPLAGKTTGFDVSLFLRAKEIVAAVPNLGAGGAVDTGAQVLYNGSFETWGLFDPAPTGWVEWKSGGSTINRITTPGFAYDGTNCMNINVPGWPSPIEYAGVYSDYTLSPTIGPSQSWRASLAIRIPPASSGGLIEILLYRATKYLQEDGTWAAAQASHAMPVAADDAWHVATKDFTMSSDAADKLRFFVRNRPNVGPYVLNAYVDLLRLDGPLQTSYSTW